jgi:hypothetical protein
MFNHKLEQEYLETFLQPAIKYAINHDRRLVVVAPYYDSYLLQKFSRDIALEFKATKTTSVVYARASVMDDYRVELFNDFAALCGCEVINENTAYEILHEQLEYKPEEYIGEVEEIELGEQSTFAKGFIKKNEAMLDILEKDAISKYQEMCEANESNTTITEALVNAKQRMSKLKCNMGVINVGGSTELAKVANYDLIEDAVKACESAYLFGVTPGQTLGIQTAICDLKESKKYKNDKVGLMFLDAISRAYRDVTRILLENKFKQNIPDDLMEKIVNRSIREQAVVDLEKTEFDFINALPVENISKEDGNFIQRLIHKIEEMFHLNDVDKVDDVVVIRDLHLDATIINSCKTDIEVLRASAGIIGLLLSSNQYIAIKL